MPMLPEDDLRNVRHGERHHFDVGERLRIVNADRVRHCRGEVRSRDDHRQRHEMRRVQHDLSVDALAHQKALEQLLASAFGANRDVLQLEELLLGELPTANRMIGSVRVRAGVG